MDTNLYSPLGDTGNPVRLLLPETGGGMDTLQYRLVVEHLKGAETIEYTALSYTWDDPVPHFAQKNSSDFDRILNSS
jgi:hypothetical protein